MDLTSKTRIPFDLVADAGERQAAFTLDYAVTAKAELSGNIFRLNGPKNFRPLVRGVVEKTLGFFSVNCGVHLTLSSSNPTALAGEREAFCVSTVLALAAAIAKRNGSINELKLDKYFIDQFFVVDGSVVQKTDLLDLCFTEGLSYAKTAASFYGGFVVSEKENILRSGEMEELSVLLVKSNSKKNNPSNNTLKTERELIWREALAGNLYPAMNLASLINSNPKNIGFIKKALSCGTLAASVEDNATALLARSEKTLKDIQKKTRIPGEKHYLKTSSEKAWVNAKPKRIYKIKEFLEIPGAQGYNII